MAYFEFWSKGKAVDEKVYKLKSKKDIDSIVSFEIEKIWSKLSSSEPGYPFDLGYMNTLLCLIFCCKSSLFLTLCFMFIL